MEVGQGRVQTGSSNGAESSRPSSPSLQLAETDTWGDRYGDALLNGADAITTDELPNNSQFLGLKTNDRELVVSLKQEIKKLRDKLRSSRAKERASKTRERASKTREKASRARERASRARERASRAKLRAKEEENREMQSVLLNLIARLSASEP